MSERYCVSRNQVEAALNALDAAGRRLVAAQPNIRWRLKADGTFLTELDGKIQRFLKRPLSRAFPSCVFVAEEDAQAIKAARALKPLLILDPIDGSAAYARRFNFFSISLAMVDGNREPLVGIVHMPARGKWYAGAREATGWVSYHVSMARGRVKVRRFDAAWANGDGTRLEDSYLYVSSDAHRQLEMSGFQGKIRALGPSASHLALLLDRTPDPAAVILTQYKLWDAVAGLALAQAAGFEIRDLRTPSQAFSMPRIVNQLIHAGRTPPLVVGSSDVVREVIRTVRMQRG